MSKVGNPPPNNLNIPHGPVASITHTHTVHTILMLSELFIGGCCGRLMGRIKFAVGFEN